MSDGLTASAGIREWRGFLLAVAVLLAVLAMPMKGFAADDLYTVSVHLDPEDPDARNIAYRDGLNLVLIRVTGSEDEQHLAELSEIFSIPSRYVLRFRPVADDTLELSFDGDAIERVLHGNLKTIWGDDRPVTLVWLAVDWGQGEREIVGADHGQQSADATRSIDRNRLLRERIEDTAERRGIPMLFPLLDIEDLQKISFSDIWGGFNDQLIEASRRYDASSILVGRIRPDSPQQNRWTYYFGEEQIGWIGEPEEVAGLVADQLAAKFAIPGGSVLESYQLMVDGIDSVVAYGRVQQLIGNLAVVENFVLRSVSGQKVEFSVSIYGGIERLNKALELSGMLYPAADPDNFDEAPIMDADRLEFVYLP